MNDALSNWDRFGENWVNNFASSFIPAIVTQTERTIDPALREARSMLDRIKSRIPVVSEQLTELVDVTGEIRAHEGTGVPLFDAFNPFYMKERRDDPGINEMQRLRYFPGRVKDKIDGINLSPEQYQEYAIMSGQNSLNETRNLVALPSWEKIPDFKKKSMIQNIWRRNRAQAKLRMKRQLIRQIIDAKRQRFLK